MTEPLNTFDDESTRKIAEVVRRELARHGNTDRRSRRPNPEASPWRNWRTGVTAAMPDQTYPESPANVLPIQYQDWTFREEEGQRDLDFEVWPSKFILARNITGGWVPEGTRVLMPRFPGKSDTYGGNAGRRWYFLAEQHTARPVLFCRTYEPASGGYPATTESTLPIQMIDIYEDEYGDVQRELLTEWENVTALSPFGWLPPLIEMEVTIDHRGRFRMVSPPPMLQGVLYSGSTIASSTWGGSCEGLVLASAATIHIYRYDGSNNLQPAEYSNGDPVLMPWTNVGDELEANVLLSAHINADRQWIMSPEHCSPCVS